VGPGSGILDEVNMPEWKGFNIPIHHITVNALFLHPNYRADANTYLKSDTTMALSPLSK